ncbi:hypothetical protein I302_100781 [Kwoniella bestiolae CBS 10118]|uniref:Uncharacterized protein n=1 Tax=Kwoniella bestiolae CBS 10118 TaxID=1296100 RepID=A0A1B9G612_9TREE|nr:hypothetical protein I302_04154 [Kwoniella bestiolae CBS 10118]OCF26469.1 hypothetical protein I302_04154 [Kwoniella bestiolae CBS 10118]
MSLLSIVGSFQAPLTILLVIFGPSLLPRLINLFRPKPPSSTPEPVRPPRPISLKLTLGIHTLWILKQLIIPPYDLFVNNNIPISTSNAQIRYTLLGPESPNQQVHPLLELLMTRLKIMDNRLLYSKFGHRSLMDCVWCQTPMDYSIYSLPDILGWYLLEAVLLGMMGWSWIAGQEAGRRAEVWRNSLGWTLVVVAITEVGVKWGWDLRVVEGDALHLASIIHTLRSIFLLSFPLTYTFLPLPSPQVSPNTLAAIISNTTSTLRLTSLARAAVQRSPRVRETWNILGKRDAERTGIARRDEDVRRIVRELSLDEAGMRVGARGWMRDGWNGMVRVDPNPNANSSTQAGM